MGSMDILLSPLCYQRCSWHGLGMQIQLNCFVRGLRVAFPGGRNPGLSGFFTEVLMLRCFSALPKPLFWNVSWLVDCDWLAVCLFWVHVLLPIILFYAGPVQCCNLFFKIYLLCLKQFQLCVKQFQVQLQGKMFSYVLSATAYSSHRQEIWGRQWLLPYSPYLI
jgi:hypothetical protein